MTDPDTGSVHICSDWKIATLPQGELVWVASCVIGEARTHIHLGDGTFHGSHVARRSLLYETFYKLMVRHRDSTGLWSSWADRGFRTSEVSQVLPLEIERIASTPTPEWMDGLSNPIVLRSGLQPPTLRVESSRGELLLEFRGMDGVNNLTIIPAPLASHSPVRVVTYGGSMGIEKPKSTLFFSNGHGDSKTISLPRLSLPPAEIMYLWVSSNGSTFLGAAGQTVPDFSQLVQGSPVPWTVETPGYTVEIVSTGYQLPVNIAFVPNPGILPNDPLYYVAELYGTIRVVSRNGVVGTYASNLLNFDPTGNFPGSGEQGLSGIVVDPTTLDIFASLLYDQPPTGGNHYPKVIRLHSTDGGLTATTQTTVLDMSADPQGQSHFISNLTIGPDGKLYVHMGDGLEPWTAQNLNSFRGKILRVNLDGTAPADNPFYNSQNGITAQDYVFAYGFRNPFGGAWRDADGAHYEVENGPGSNDRFAKVVAGQNYGWDGGGNGMTSYAIYNWVETHAPVNVAFIQPSVFGGSNFASDKQDHAFVTESGPTWATGAQQRGKRIVEFVLDSVGRRISGPTTFVAYNGSGKASAVGLAAGPDGLYFSDLYKDQDFASAIDRGANILRIRYTGIAGPASTSLRSFTFCVDEEKRVRLEWTTSVEGNLLGFEVQWSLPEPIRFEPVSNSFVPGHMNSTGPNSYSFTHNLQNDVILYRLKLLNADSTARYSSTVRVNPTDRHHDCAPRTITLLQNYPNPFNPRTEIRFSVNATSRTSVEMYNILGERVGTLFDGIAEPGRFHVAEVDGTNFSSGLYFYRLEVNGLTKVRKMMILK